MKSRKASGKGEAHRSANEGCAAFEMLESRLLLSVAPVVTTDATALNYIQGHLRMAVDPTLTVADGDSTSLAGATVSITGNFASGEDLLGFTDQNGITGSYNATTGVLTLTGSSLIANYQTALQSVTYGDLSASPSTSDRTVTFVANDGTDNSAPATRTLTFTSDSAPVVTTSVGSASYSQLTGAAAVDSGLTLTDADSPNLQGATVSITSNFVTGQDVLAFTNQNGITGSYNSTTGVLTLTGSATLANYQTALRSVTYADSASGASTLTRTVTFTVTDGIYTSASATRNVTVTADSLSVVTTTGTALTYVQANGSAAVDSGLTVSDADNSTLTGATVSITGNFAASQDVLGFTNQNGITGSYNASTGVLTLSGTASVANYQAALRSVVFNNTSSTPGTLTRTVSFKVNDGLFDSTSATRDITFQADVAPVVTPTGTALGYHQSGGAAAVDSGVTIADSDSTNLTGATVSITGNYDSGKDVLAFTTQNGISGTWNSTTGVMTLTGTATVAQYQTALQSVTYNNTSTTPSTLTRTVTFAVSDGILGSTSATRDINFTADAAPVVTTTSTALTYLVVNGAVAVDSGITVTDSDSTNLTKAYVWISTNYLSTYDTLAFTNQNGITGSWDSSTGVLTLTGTATVAEYQTALASVTYYNSNPNPGLLTRVISFAVYDGLSYSDIATRSITIQNDSAPVLTTSPSVLRYAQNDGNVIVDPGITVTDSDSTALTGVVVWVSGNYVAGEDVLGVTANQAGITSSFNAATGELSLSGAASLATWQAELRSVTYLSSLSPNTDARTVSFRANDGFALSAAASRIISLVPLRTDRYESNDYSWTATSIPLSDRGTGILTGATITPGADVDWYSFVVPYGASGNVLVTAGNVGGGLLAHVAIYDSIVGSLSDLYGGVYGQLYGPKGTTGDSTAGNQSVTASWSGLVPGRTYYAKVSSIGSTTGVYDIGVTCFMTLAQDAFELNNTSGSASDVTSGLVAGGGVMPLAGLNIDNGNDVDWFRINAPANTDGNLTVTISNLTGGLAGTLYVYQNIAHVSDPVLIAGNVFASYITGGTSSVTLYNAQPGTAYFIRVDNFLNETGGYRLDVSVPLDQQVKDAFEGGAGNNQSWLAAPLLPVGGPIALNSLSIHNWNDQDWFSFITNANGTATITATGADMRGLNAHLGLYASPVGSLADQYGGIYSSLYGPLGTADAAGANQPVTLTVTGLQAYHVYYVKVSGNGLSTGLYSLGISVTPVVGVPEVV